MRRPASCQSRHGPSSWWISTCPQGTGIEVTAAELVEAEAHVRGKPGVTHVTSFVGQVGLRFMLTYVPENPNSSYGQRLVDVADASQIAPMIAELQTELDAR
jgi:multidrug efflux pump subunit AcrB